jgi:hypothetical protein
MKMALSVTLAFGSDILKDDLLDRSATSLIRPPRSRCGTHYFMNTAPAQERPFVNNQTRRVVGKLRLRADR